VTFFHDHNQDGESGRPAALFNAQWHRRALAGDHDSIAMFAQQLLEPLYRFCFHRLGRNQALAEDVAQETMLLAIERLDSYDPRRSDGRIWGWLSGLARNEIRRVLKHYEIGSSLQQFWDATDERLLEALRQIESQMLTEADVLRHETRQLVNVTMSQLPVHYQKVLEAKYMNGESLNQMAASLGVSIEAVESTLRRARRSFRETFEIFTRSIERGTASGSEGMAS
jgi:RNA polymerase sigma-70 factor, ECF subfamily